MNRQERIDTSCAIGIVVVLLILLGSWIQSSLQPASASEPPAAAVTAPQPAITAPAATLPVDSPTVATVAAEVCEEDEPCWDCATMGNRICGPVAPAPDAAASATCDDCDADEGEQIDPAELAEIAAADAAVAPCELGKPYWDCAMMPCAEEDSAGAPCYWDAQQRGNGLGRSFIWTGSEVVYTSN